MIYKRFTTDELNSIKKFLLRVDIDVLKEFPRVIDFFIHIVKPSHYEPLKTYSGLPIINGRFFRMAHFSPFVIGAKYGGHDQWGILGSINIRHNWSPNDIIFTKEEFKEIIEDLSLIVLSIDSELQIEFDYTEFWSSGPVIKP